MAFVKGAFVGVIQSCLYNLYKCDHPKNKTRDYALGGVALGGEAELDNPYYALYDDFNGSGDLADHIPEIGNIWTLGTGVFTLSGGLLSLSRESDGQRRIIFSNDIPNADTTLDLYMEFTADFESGMNIDFNRIDDANRWSIYFSPPYLMLSNYVGGSQTGYGTDTGVIGPTTLHLTIITNDDVVEVYKNGGLILSANVADRPNKEGTGIRFNWFDNSGIVQFEKIKALGVFNPP